MAEDTLDFLNLTFKNLGRSEINTSGYFIKKMLHAWRFFTNFNFFYNVKFDSLNNSILVKNKI